MKSFFLAIQLLTIFPIKFIGKVEPHELGKSTAFFPLVGAIQGIILVLSNIILSRFLPYSVADGLLLVILLLTNGGFHLDGFADTIDGIAGGGTKEERLKIMRGSQIGAIGVAGVVFLILIKFLAINNIPFESKNEILFLLPVFGRWAIVPMAYWGNYARAGDGVGKAFAEHTKTRELVIATGDVIIFSAIFLKLKLLFLIPVMFLFIYLATLFFKKKIGGITGDVFGFQSELAEVLFLVMALSLAAA